MIKAGEFPSFKPSRAERIGWALLYLFALALATVLFPFSFWAVWSGVPMLGFAIIMGFPMMVMAAVLVAASCLSFLPSIGLVFSVFWFGSMRRERRYRMAIAPVCLAEATVRVETSGTAGDPVTITSGQRGVLLGRDLNSEVTLRLIGRSQVRAGEEGTAELCFPRNAERPTGLGQGVEFELLDLRRRLLGRGVVSQLWFQPAR
jgi:uncharacterized membrane protein